MPKTQTQRVEIALLKVIEDKNSTVRQVLEASKQLIQIKRVRPKRRAPGAGRKPSVGEAPLSVLGSK